MSEKSIVADKVASLRTWFNTGGEGEYYLRRTNPNIVDHDSVEGCFRFETTIPIRDFIGGLMYHDALQLEEQTGYQVDASVLLDQVVVEFTGTKPVIKPVTTL